MDLRSLVLFFGLWQVTYFLVSRLVTQFLSHPLGETLIPEKDARFTLKHHSPAYLVSTIHALIVTIRGLQHFRHLYYAPVLVKILRPPPAIAASLPTSSQAFIPETERVLFTNLILAGYLLADLVHILYHYPSIGGLDIIAHHIAFLCCALVAGWYELWPYMFSLLIIGEASTPLLNARWILIRSNRGHTWYFKLVEKAFVIVFIVMRFFVYGAGLAYHITILGDVPDVVPKWAVAATVVSVVSGFVLNLTWLKKIYKLATGTGKRRRRPRAEQVRSQTAAEPVKTE